MTDEGERLVKLETSMETATAEIAELKADRKNAFKWGILTLGAAVIALGGFIVTRWHGG